MQIDVSKIEGYAEMTPEQKIAALEGYDMKVEGLKYEEGKLKRQLDESLSKVAALTKEVRASRTAEENAKADFEAKYKEMENKVAAYEKEKTVSNLVQRYMGEGMNQETATKIVEARLSGDLDAEFAVLSAHRDTLSKNAMASAMDNQKGITSGSSLAGSSANDDDLSDAEYYAKHNTVY